jgi:NADH-quinone oxidoreductase subunit L
MPVGDLQIDAAFQLDQLSMLMVLIVTGVGALIHVFSVGYMREDPGYPRYFAYLNLFVFFMLVLVLGANYPIMFIGWEGVGLCSYLLIGFWFSEKANADAGKKAFIVNRIGDFLPDRDVPVVREHRHARFPGRHRGAKALASAAGGDGDLPVPVPRLRRGQERADPLYIWLP